MRRILKGFYNGMVYGMTLVMVIIVLFMIIGLVALFPIRGQTTFLAYLFVCGIIGIVKEFKSSH